MQATLKICHDLLLVGIFADQLLMFFVRIGRRERIIYIRVVDVVVCDKSWKRFSGGEREKREIIINLLALLQQRKRNWQFLLLDHKRMFSILSCFSSLRRVSIKARFIHRVRSFHVSAREESSAVNFRGYRAIKEIAKGFRGLVKTEKYAKRWKTFLFRCFSSSFSCH